MYYAYVLQSIENRDYLYKGSCSNMARRLKQHNEGKTRSNRLYRPFIVLHYEKFDTLEEALEREKYWKTAAGRRYLQSLIQNGLVVQWIE